MFSQVDTQQNTQADYSEASERFMESDSLVRTNYFTDNILYPKNFVPQFLNKYKGNDFDYQTAKPEESTWEKIKKKLAELLSKIFSDLDPKKTANYATYILRFIGILAACGLLYFLIRYLMSKDGNLFFGKKNKKISSSILGETENIHEINFPKTIQKLENEKDYRSAIRYQFLYALKKMADKNIIHYHPEKTNRDYLQELQNSKLRNEFGRIIYIYDYIWYGEFQAEEADYINYKAHFNNF